MTTVPFETKFTDAKSAESLTATLGRLVANVPGFVYRSRPDAQRTMEFVSAQCRDVTGYDPHRFIENQSLTYTLLIHPDDRSRVDWTVFAAAMDGRRFTCHYRLQTAYRAWVEVVDRGIGVLDESGRLCAIEGYVSRACGHGRQMSAQPEATFTSEPGTDSSSLIGNDDATSELVDRLLSTRTSDSCGRVSHVD